jgi:hypothetical protein
MFVDLRFGLAPLQNPHGLDQHARQLSTLRMSILDAPSAPTAARSYLLHLSIRNV